MGKDQTEALWQSKIVHGMYHRQIAEMADIDNPTSG